MVRTCRKERSRVCREDTGDKCSFVVGLRLQSFLIFPHIFSIGFKCGLLAGQLGKLVSTFVGEPTILWSISLSKTS